MAVSLPPPSDCGNVAVIVTGPPVVTPMALKLAVVAPALIVTEAGTVTILVLAELSVTIVLLCCAMLSVAVNCPA